MVATAVYSVTMAEVARGCLPPGANVCVAAPANQIGNRYSYGYNDDVGVVSRTLR